MNLHRTYVTPAGAVCSCGETYAINHPNAGLSWARMHHRQNTTSESSKIVDLRRVNRNNLHDVKT